MYVTRALLLPALILVAIAAGTARADPNPASAYPLVLESEQALVLDPRTGETLYAKNAEHQAPIASLTKLMTAVVILDAKLPLSQKITITKADADRHKHTSSRLSFGTRLSRQDLLHLSLMASENRAAAALARTYPGGTKAFVAAMNKKAKSLGMHDTRFVDGTGLREANKSTPRDLAKLVVAASKYPVIRETSTYPGMSVAVPAKKRVKVKQKGKTKIVTRSGTRKVAYRNTNELTRAEDWDIRVSKTGYLRESGRCLVLDARIALRDVVIVLLDAKDKTQRTNDARAIRMWLTSGG